MHVAGLGNGRSTYPRRLSSLERRVLTAAQAGTEVVLGEAVPKPDAVDNVISGEVIRDALSGKHGPLHHRGLFVRGARIVGDVDLSYLRWQGELSLVDCLVDGEVRLDYARPIGKVCLDGTCVYRVSAVGAFVDGALYLRKGFCSQTGFFAIRIRVSGALNLKGSRIGGPEDIPTRQAVEIFGADLGDLFLSNARIDGGVYAVGISVAKNVRLQGSQICSRGAMGWQGGVERELGVTLASSEVRGSIYLSGLTPGVGVRVDGRMRLNGASCKRLAVRSGDLEPNDVDLGGVIYSQLLFIEPGELLVELRRSAHFSTQSYVQLAAYCATIGDVAARRKVLTSLERRLTDTLSWRSPLKLMRILHGAFVGYGYRSVMAIPWLLGCVLASVLLLHTYGDFLVGKASGRELRWSDCVGISLDNLLPFASLGIKDGWTAHAQSIGQWCWLLLFLALKFGAWGLVALALASITGVVRKL